MGSSSLLGFDKRILFYSLFFCLPTSSSVSFEMSISMGRRDVIGYRVAPHFITPCLFAYHCNTPSVQELFCDLLFHMLFLNWDGFGEEGLKLLARKLSLQCSNKDASYTQLSLAMDSCLTMFLNTFLLQLFLKCHTTLLDQTLLSQSSLKMFIQKWISVHTNKPRKVKLVLLQSGLIYV